MKAFYLMATATVSLLLSFAPPIRACSMCRSGNQSFFINSARVLPPGKVIISVENFHLSKSSASNSSICSEDHHSSAMKSLLHGEGHESHVSDNLQIVVNYGLIDNVMLMAAVPYVFNHLSNLSEEITSHGFGDPEVSAIVPLVSLFKSQFLVAGNVSVRVPLGRTDLKADNGALLHQHCQPGTGAWAGTLGLQLSNVSGSVPLFFSLDYQINSRNAEGFRYGNVARFNLALQRQISKAIDFIGEFNGRYARFDFAADGKDPHSGGTVVYFSPGLRFNLISNLAIRGQVQLPFIEKLNGVQDEKTNFRGGLVWTL